MKSLKSKLVQGGLQRTLMALTPKIYRRYCFSFNRNNEYINIIYSNITTKIHDSIYKITYFN